MYIVNTQCTNYIKQSTSVVDNTRLRSFELVALIRRMVQQDPQRIKETSNSILIVSAVCPLPLSSIYTTIEGMVVGR